MTNCQRTIIRPALSRQSVEQLADLPPLLRRIYALRGVSDPDELKYNLSALIPPEQLGGTAGAAKLIHQVMENNGRILIVADFDADGATSCALAVRSLAAMGAEQVMFIVPNRFSDGYGLTEEIARKATDFAPDLVITVDNGISSLKGVALLREKSIAVLVTDHHLPGSELPNANVIVNPNSPDDSFSSRHLAGVGVVFYVMVALRAWLRQIGWFKSRDLAEPNLADFLDLVALGTVADVVRLDYNNRILVQQGLARIRAGRCCPLIREIFSKAGKSLSQAVAADLGFVVGPRLNAVGRLDDMSVGIAALISDSSIQAAQTADLLDQMNSERKQIEQTMKEQALEHLNLLKLGEQLPYGLCVYQEGWHQGVIGILASRIKDRYYRPVIAFAEADENTLKGSARSIEGLHIRDTLEAIAVTYPRLLQKFGGHAMAAGLTLAKSDFVEFCRRFDEAVAIQLRGQSLTDELVSDGSLESDELDLQLAEQLDQAGPWGQGFAEPLFDDWFEITQQRTVGGRHAKMTLRRRDCAESLEAIAFNQAESMPAQPGATIHAAYRLSVNEFRGARTLQLMIEYFQVVK